MRHNFYCILASLCIFVATDAYPAIMVQQSAVDVACFDVFELEVQLDEAVPGNPFTEFDVQAVFTPENSDPIVVKGFCDDQEGKIYRVRFCPSRPATEYTYTLTTSRAYDKSYTGTFRTVGVSGLEPVIANPDFLKHFMYAKSGQPFYHLGITAYHLLDPSNDEQHIEDFLDYCLEHGINKVRFLLTGYPRDTDTRSSDDYEYGVGDQWKKPNYGAPPGEVNPLPAWRGKPHDYDFTRFNVSYWQKVDRAVRAMRERGIVATCIFTIEKQNLPKEYGTLTDHEKRLYHYAVNRLAAFSNVWWDLGNEHNEFRKKDWAPKMGALVKEWDPYDRLCSAHGYADWLYDNQEWADFIITQQYGNCREVNEWALKYYEIPMPYINEEYGYEGTLDKPEHGMNADWVRKCHWSIALAGGYATYGDWTPGTHFYTGHIGEGKAPPQLKILRDTFETLPYTEMKPRNEILGEGAFCLAKTGEVYLVYLYDGGSTNISVKQSKNGYRISWLNPRTGEMTRSSEQNLTEIILQPPTEEDWVAVIKAVPSTTMIFPKEEWRESVPEAQGVDPEKLDAAAEYLKNNSGKDGVEQLVVIRNGYMIWKGSNIDAVHGVWSLTKSFTSTVLGLLIDEGKTALDMPAHEYVPELEKTYPKVTLRHFTTMTSGYRAQGDEPRGGYLHGPSTTPFIPSPNPLFTPPGSHYAYWDSAMNEFANVLTHIAGKKIEEYFKRKIADPIGMNSKQWDWGEFGEVDGIAVNGGSGNNNKHMFISARELARFGLLFLNEGNWNGKQLISKSWVDAVASVQVPSTIPLGHPESNIDGRGIYSFNWWVNGVRANGERKWPDAPLGTYSASGYNNNDMFVIPEWNMVIVRLGLDQNDHFISDEIYNTFLKKVGEAVKVPSPVKTIRIDAIDEPLPDKITPFFSPPEKYADKFGDYRSPLKFYDGTPVNTKEDWWKRREEIKKKWHELMNPWPLLIANPNIEYVSKEKRENFIQHMVDVEIAPDHRTIDGYLLVPESGERPLPAVIVVYYEPDTGIGMGREGRDFAYQMAKRGFVALSVGMGASLYYPSKENAAFQPLSALAYAAANCYNALANLDYVDPERIGILGHSYGGKWAMFASCLYDKFACAAWSDGGIVFDESRPNVNYWEPWYLGYETGYTRERGVPNEDRPRTGSYKKMIEEGYDLHELHALMAPRPFLVSGGSEDQPERWIPLNHAIAVNEFLGYENRVAMTNREGHGPTPESNEQMYTFLEYFLK